ncbi:MAG: DUF898 family protein [Tidjanibacter sp.]|nr:DUF898 family protein [Tidjanibacter sp.]
MKNYFNITIRARQFVPYFFYMLILCIGVSVVSVLLGFSSNTIATVIDGHYFLMLGGELLLGILTLVGLCLLTLPMLTNIFKTTIYRDQPLEADFDTKEFIWLIIKGSILSCITLGIYVPWFIAGLMRYFADGLSHGFSRLSFRGKGGRLFSVIVLALIVPMVVAMLLIGVATGVNLSGESGVAILCVLVALLVMIVAMTFYQIYYYGWYINLTYGGRRIVLGCKAGTLFWTVLGEMVLSFLSLGIYLPMALLRIYRAFAREIVVGDKLIDARGGMSLRPWNDWAYCWGQVLLIVITLGIYSPWAALRLMRRFGSRVYFKTIEKPTEAMPE